MNKEEQKNRYEKWRDLIKEQELSGIAQGEFCKGRGISSAQMSYYRSIFKPKQVQAGTFAPVTIKPSSVKDIRIILPNTFQCVFPSDLNPSQVKEWITVLLSC